MAPKKPTPKPAPKKAAKPAPKAVKPVLKPTAKPAVKAGSVPVKQPALPATANRPQAKLTTWPAEEPTPHHHHGDCCGHHHGPSLCAMVSCCPVGKLLCTRSFWAASVVAFLVIFATDWLLHTRFLMQDYAATSSLWRAENEIRHSLIFITQALTAMAYAAIILGMGHAGKWWGSAVSGMLAASVAAISAMSAYIMLPFAEAYIPTVWAIASLAQGALCGLAVCAALRVSRAPEAAACCAHQPHTLH